MEMEEDLFSESDLIPSNAENENKTSLSNTSKNEMGNQNNTADDVDGASATSSSKQDPLSSSSCPSDEVNQAGSSNSDSKINSIFGPEGLIAKYSDNDNMGPSGSPPFHVPAVSVPIGEKCSQGDEKVRLFKKRKLFRGPNDHVKNTQKTTVSRAMSIVSNNSFNMDTETEAENGNDMDSDGDPTAAQKAFGIELIVKKIFSLLEIKHLKAVRLVSPHWAQLGSKEIQKRIKITFHFRLQNGEHDYWSTVNQHSLTSLIQLLELKSASEEMSGSAFEFPCNFFEFYPAILSQQTLCHFLNIYGIHLKKLKLYLNYVSQDSYNVSSLSHMETLLVEQAPSLNYLELRMDISDEIEEQTKGKTFLIQNQNKSQENEETRNNCGKHVHILLPNLSVLKMWDGVHRGILDGIFNSAKNLREVCVDSENLHYLMEPTNRLHLLKKLTLDLDYDDVESMEIIASHENLGLRKLIFHLNHQYSLQHHWPRMTRALNKILKSSCGTLEKITWGPVGVLQGIQIPKMPKLKKLTMEIEDLGVDFEIGRNEYFFPQGFSVSEMFPKLTSIFMLNGWMIAKYGFSSYFNSTEVLPSIKYFRINHLSRNRISEEDMEWFSRIFPNAVLLFWPGGA